MMQKILTLCTLLALTVCWLGGCSGGGNNATLGGGSAGQATLTIKWPAPTRLIPLAANCILVHFAGPNGFLATQEADRPYNGGTSTLTFNQLPLHPLTVTATAYPSIGAQGVAQARATVPLTPRAGVNTPLNLTMLSTIDHVTVNPASASVIEGATTPFSATAYDAAGNIVLVGASNMIWSSANTAIATVNASSGVATGVAAGSTTITATESESGKAGSVALTVTPPPPGTILATVPLSGGLATGGSGQVIAVNPLTNRIYVANWLGSTVNVIDGNTNILLTSVSVGSYPQAIAVNPTTNKIYVVSNANSAVSVIDGSTDTVQTTVTVGTDPVAVAVNSNPTINRVYVTNWHDHTVSVLDGSSNSVMATISVGNLPYNLAANTSTNQVYIYNSGDTTMSVLDGATNNVSTFSVGGSVGGIAVNSLTNRIYTSGLQSNTLSVLDGSTLASYASVAVGNTPVAVAVNSVTNWAYVANQDDGTVSVLNGSTNTIVATPNTGGGIGMAVNTTTNRVYLCSPTTLIVMQGY
jgi:YVTN family beta-propeller protein